MHSQVSAASVYLHVKPGAPACVLVWVVKWAAECTCCMCICVLHVFLCCSCVSLCSCTFVRCSSCLCVCFCLSMPPDAFFANPRTFLIQLFWWKGHNSLFPLGDRLKIPDLPLRAKLQILSRLYLRQLCKLKFWIRSSDKIYGEVINTAATRLQKAHPPPAAACWLCIHSAQAVHNPPCLWSMVSAWLSCNHSSCTWL